jgi:TRAP-type C4-dicarboxylate transport system permease small subunit
MYRVLDRVSDLLRHAAAVLGVVAALVMIASLLLGVFYRYVLESSLAWSDELALLAFTWTVFLISSTMIRDAGHVRVTVLLDLLRWPVNEVLERLIFFVLLGFGLVMIWTGWQFTEFTWSQVSPAIRYPLWWRNAALPVGGALIALHAFVALVSPKRITTDARGEA